MKAMQGPGMYHRMELAAQRLFSGASMWIQRLFMTVISDYCLSIIGSVMPRRDYHRDAGNFAERYGRDCNRGFAGYSAYLIDGRWLSRYFPCTVLLTLREETPC